VIVIDASVTLAWFFEDERTPPVVALSNSVGMSGAVVPMLWPLEIASGFRTAIRRGRIDSAFRDASFVKLAYLPIEIDEETNQHAWHATLRLADRYDLTPYDAAYLELAQRRRLSLATLDRRLDQAARDAGVESGLLN
jgi:predicted nucleic acid-binding protein